MEKGIKLDKEKIRFDLVLPEFEEAVAKVLTFGAKKYEPDSWKKIENPVNRYYAALRRHLCAWRKGNKTDKESKLPHLYHAAANIMFLIYFMEHENGRPE